MLRSREPAPGLAEGARFELAVHEVDAGFQDRWFQPLTHPSDNVFNYLGYAPCFCLSIRLSICEVPKASATSPPLEIDVPPILVSNDRLCASDGRCSS